MKASTKQRLFWIASTLFIAAIIFFFSSQASGKSENLSDAFAGVLRIEQAEENIRVSNQRLILGISLRKLAHVFLFALLGFCLLILSKASDFGHVSLLEQDFCME